MGVTRHLKGRNKNRGDGVNRGSVESRKEKKKKTNRSGKGVGLGEVTSVHSSYTSVLHGAMGPCLWDLATTHSGFFCSLP